MSKAAAKKALTAGVRAAEATIGRRRLVQLARFVTDEVRLDKQHGIEANGEALIQRAARTAAQPVVFDVGCHFGEWSATLLAQPGNDPAIHAFEPSAHSAAKARATLGPRADVHQVALSSGSGEAELKIVHEGAGSSSLVPFTDQRRPSGQTEKVLLETVDGFASAHGIDRITLLKIDAEGHDLEVLRGAGRMLRGNRIELVQFEYNLRWIDARLFLLDAFELLAGCGYRMGKVTPRGVETYDSWHPELESFRQGNYLGFRREWQSRLATFPWWGPA